MEIFHSSVNFSTEIIEKFKKEISSSDEINNREDYCIYTTGSFARLEAGKNSDLDLFFLFKNEEDKFPNITKTLINADIINICRNMGFPEFSDDGTYLEFHNVKDVYSQLGSRNDDYYNFFTARMLLLLESRPLYNSDLYDSIIKEVVEKYYIDFHKNETNFSPAFLVNDIIRFWRTLCLNYEHNRNRKSDSSDENEKKRKKSKAHIKNLKLKFSRKLTCYSFLLSVLYSTDVLDKAKILDIIRLTPLERLNNLLDNNPTCGSKINEMFVLYEWFLKITHVNEEDLIDWISDKDNRDEAFGKARDFAKLIYDLIINSESDKLIYFVI